MQTVLDILDRVAATPSKKEKESILADALPSSPLLQQVAKYALDQGKSYNLTALPEVIVADVIHEDPVKIFSYLDFLASKRGATDVEARTLAGMCHSSAAHEVVTRIIQKDLDIGAKANTFNKAMADLIYVVPYNRYSSFAKVKPEELENKSLIVQQKNDGFFAYMQDPEIPSNTPPFCTRQGNTFSLNGFIEQDFHWLRPIQDYHKEPIRLEGELLVLEDNGRYMARAKGNGLLAEFYNGDYTPGFGERIRYIIWGYVTESEFLARKSDRVYRQVWGNLKVAYARNMGQTGDISLTHSMAVSGYGEAMDFYRKMRSQGLEGAMLKLADELVWKNNSSGNPYGFKMKAEAEAEFEIVDAYPGDPKGKWKNGLGGLVVKSSCGKILTNIGGGFSDKERELGVDYWKSKIGKIITGKFTDIVTDKTSRETFCLEHSRLPNMGGAMVETRFSEKEEADDLEYCRAQLIAA